MTPTELADAFECLPNDATAKSWQLNTVGTAGLEVSHDDFGTAEDAWAALVERPLRAGWIQWQSHQMHFTDGLPDYELGWSALLAAEAVVTDTDSLRLDYLDGQWRLTHYRHLPDGDGCLCDETHYLLHGADRKLRYRRYWTIDAEQGAVPACAVLAGIAKKED